MGQRYNLNGSTGHRRKPGCKSTRQALLVIKVEREIEMGGPVIGKLNEKSPGEPGDFQLKRKPTIAHLSMGEFYYLEQKYWLSPSLEMTLLSRGDDQCHMNGIPIGLFF
ncbi:MAG: hypothetical protein GC171_01460 [Terrimonas sp.]|nr:hypothetical protein [Terrimonas sp.]